MGIETSGTGARTFDAARAAFAAAGAAWDPDSCTDPIARTVMSDQNPFALKVAAYRDANKTELAEHRNFGGSAISQLSSALAYIASLPQLSAQQAEATAGEPGIDARPVPQLAIREALVNAIATATTRPTPAPPSST